MNHKTKLLNILKAISPQDRVDFSSLDNEIEKLKTALREKVHAQTLEDVTIQLEKFKKKFDLKPLLEAVAKLESSIDLKIKGISGILNQESNTLKSLLASKETRDADQISTIASNIESLKTELSRLNEQKNTELKGLKDKLDGLFDFSINAQKNFLKVEKDIQGIKDSKELENTIKEFNEIIETVKRDLINRILSLPHGGNMNRNIAIGGNTSVLGRYTDVNIKAGSNVTLTYANNDTTKYLDLTIASSGGGGSVAGVTRQIQTTTISSVIAGLSGIDQVTLVNGGVRIELPTAVGDLQLYTIKNVGTSSVLIATTGGQTIDAQATIIMPVQYTSVDLI